MAKTYNEIAGKSLERIVTLSDGVFAIAMTLLVLEIRPPAHAQVHGEAALWAGLMALAPRFLMYLTSFMTLGMFWIGQQTHLDSFERADRNLTWIHVAFLASVSMLPFSTSLMADFLDYKVALAVYWLNMLVPGCVLYASWAYGGAAKLFRADMDAAAPAIGKRRILIGQGLYFAAALTGFYHPVLAISLILLAQFDSALGLKWGVLGRF